MKPVIDPRRGDVEDDASSSKRRSLLSLAGSLLAEISLPKLAVAWFLLIVGPGLVLGVAPVVAAIWLNKLSTRLEYPVAGIWPLVILAVLVAVGWFGGHTLFRLAEQSFWSLNSLAVQPAYTMCREALPRSRRGGCRRVPPRRNARGCVRPRAMVSGVVICAVALAVVAVGAAEARIRSARSIGRRHGGTPRGGRARQHHRGRPRRRSRRGRPGLGDRRRDHGAAAGFRRVRRASERGKNLARRAPFGCARRGRTLRLPDRKRAGRGRAATNVCGGCWPKLDLLHTSEPLDAILITGDMTDAGRSSEWADFMDAVSRHPRLAERMLMIPGNHDLNIVDRANPGPARSADQPEQAVAQAAGPVRDGRGARRPRSGRGSHARPPGRDAWRRR